MPITWVTWCEEPIHWERPWCWEALKVGGEGDNRRLDGWMASPTQRTWVWASSGDGEVCGCLAHCPMGSERVRHNWVTDKNNHNINLAYIMNSYNRIVERPMASSSNGRRNWTGIFTEDRRMALNAHTALDPVSYRGWRSQGG